MQLNQKGISKKTKVSCVIKLQSRQKWPEHEFYTVKSTAKNKILRSEFFKAKSVSWKTSATKVS